MDKNETWKIAIDVGGTFTDCISQTPQGKIIWTKVLSSAISKGTVSSQRSDNTFSDQHRTADPTGFWNGYQINLIDHSGELVARSVVDFFDANRGEFQIADKIDWPDTGSVRYELVGGETAPLLAIRKITGLGLQETLPPMSVRLGTTRGTNALITRTGSPTALVTTRGFADMLEIGEQNRDRLFDLTVQKRIPLYQRVMEVDERVLSNGRIRVMLDDETVRNQLQTLRDSGIESVAICFLHGYLFPDHERRVAALARETGFKEISLSSQVAPLIKLVPRGETTVLDAYLNPVLRAYLLDFSRHLNADSRLRLMTSAGGLVPISRFGGKESILSGPAGGVVGFSHIAQSYGFAKSIGFDMGGTSTDVARFENEFERVYESEKAGVRIVSPLMEIETVAAGGGSICNFDGTRLTVGPDSAGAEPGPASYGRGGPLCVTDLNLYLGRIVPSKFPFELDTAAVIRKLDDLRERLVREAQIQYTREVLAEGLLEVAVTNMASAARTVSVSKGFDPRDHVLVVYGGAASQHACRVADQLSMTQIISHPQASILSAVGIAHAARSCHRSAALHCLLEPSFQSEIDAVHERLKAEAVANLVSEGLSLDEIEVRFLLDLRYRGTHASTTIEAAEFNQFAQGFAARHRQLFGYEMPSPIEVCAARVEVAERQSQETISTDFVRGANAVATEFQSCVFDAQQVETPVFERYQLSTGDQILGPAIIVDDFSSVVIEHSWQALVLPEQAVLLERRSATSNSHKEKPTLDTTLGPDPVQLEIFNNHFSSIAWQMGEMLRRTATSVNVKERLDFSCAIFTETGELVVNAPHVPVHLGAMGETVRTTIRLNSTIVPGDVFVSNDPFQGGSHLPDITVITPVFDASQQLIFFVASRCHHAEIGGATAGSMSPVASSLAEEGVLISNFRLLAQGESHWVQLKQLLQSGPYPSRTPDTNIADIKAQVAANRRGEMQLVELVDKYSYPVVRQYMQFIQSAAERKTRSALRRLPNRESTFEDCMDCGAVIKLCIKKQDDRLQFDFTGTDPQLPNSLNANRAITTAAIMYCLRCLIDEDIPLNEGILKPVELILPECFLNPKHQDDPRLAPAVSGGNVETSQRIVDVILGGLGVAAASQGTMNNFLMGDQSFGYYETICGGTGATQHADGASAVHSHMTNTRLTDPEIVESQFPVILNRFEIRRGSGGAGEYRGGDGVTREFEFLAPLQVTLVSNRRTTQPYGMAGGHPGTSGRNTLIRADGTRHNPGYQCLLQIEPGDRMIIETPGGGGWGKPPSNE